MTNSERAPGEAAPADMPLERVEAELCTLAGQIAAATARFLRLLADFDARDGLGRLGSRVLRPLAVVALRPRPAYCT